MNLKSIITLSGRICSGKSHAAKLIHFEFGFPVVSFGSYLKHYCEQRNLRTDRQTLQNTGEVLVKNDSKKFLSDVLAYFPLTGDTIILDGVRHESIFNGVSGLTQNRFSIFVEADFETRYKRHCQKYKDTKDLRTIEEFGTEDNHPVEMETESLKSLCDIRVDSTIGYWNDLSNRIANFILLKQ